MSSRIFKHQREDGFCILVQEVPDAQVVSVVIGVKAGSADEGPNQWGAAHFVEHMLFKGTDRRGLGEIDEEIEGLGGSINAYTSHDETVYYCTLRGSHWRQGLELLVDMLSNSLFRPEDLKIERQVILEELRGTQESPGEVLGRGLSKALWPAHPYGRPVGALPEQVVELKSSDIQAFWKTWYGPAQMVLSVAGPVAPADVLAATKKIFQNGTGAVLPKRPSGAPNSKREWILMETPFQDSLFEMAFPALPLGHPDVAALDVLATALGGSESSPLVAALQLESGVANSAWASVSPRKDGGVFYVGCQPARGREAEAIAATWAVLQSAISKGLSEEEVERTKALIRGERKLGLQTVESKALDALWYEMQNGNPAGGDRYNADIAAVSLEQVMALAEDLFSVDRATSALVCPQGAVDSKQIQALLPHDTGQKTSGLKAAPAIVDRATRFECALPGGAKLLVEPRGKGVLSALRVLGLGGRLLETPRTAGRARVWSTAVVCGAGPLNNQEFANRLSLRGAGLAAASYGPTMKMGIDCRREVLDEALEWMTWLMFEPHFDPEEVSRLRREALEGLESLVDRPGAMTWEAVSRLLFGKHPYGLSKLGSKHSIGGLTSAKLRRIHNRWVQSENLVFSVVGTGEPERIAERLTRLLAPLSQSKGRVPVVPKPVFPSTDVERVVRAGQGQSQVVLAWGTQGLEQADRLALDLGAAVMGSPGGRLFKVLRDKHALAYDVDASHATAPEGGVFSLDLSTEAARSEEGRDRLMTELEYVATQGVCKQELERAKAKVFFSRVEALQVPGSRAAELAYWERCKGNGFERVDQELAALERVGPADVQQAISALLARGGRVCVRSLPLK
jgi:zinc protease